MIRFDTLKTEILIHLDKFEKDNKLFILDTINKFKEKMSDSVGRENMLSDRAFFESIKFYNDDFDDKKKILKRYLGYAKNHDDLYVIILKMEYLFIKS